MKTSSIQGRVVKASDQDLEHVAGCAVLEPETPFPAGKWKGQVSFGRAERPYGEQGTRWWLLRDWQSPSESAGACESGRPRALEPTHAVEAVERTLVSRRGARVSEFQDTLSSFCLYIGISLSVVQDQPHQISSGLITSVYIDSHPSGQLTHCGAILRSPGDLQARWGLRTTGWTTPRRSSACLNLSAMTNWAILQSSDLSRPGMMQAGDVNGRYVENDKFMNTWIKIGCREKSGYTL